ncbi:outer membrane beta-barrel protein [Methylophilales bacterium]|nr:outer membrane beta-barrel protein [Methylophilales bacterium]
MKKNILKQIFLVLSLTLTANLYSQENINWSGPFVGVDVGYTWTNDKKNNASRDGFSYHAENKDNGGLIGINTGYNFMLNEKWLLGFIGEYKTYDAQDSDVDLKDGVPDDVTTVSAVDQKVSLLAKLGYLIDSKTLFFITGGFATAQMSRHYDEVTPNRSEKHKDWQNGWSIGFGSAYNFHENLSANLEYRYTDLRTNDINIAMWNNAPQPQKVSQDEVTFGITYHF